MDIYHSPFRLDGAAGFGKEAEKALESWEAVSLLFIIQEARQSHVETFMR